MTGIVAQLLTFPLGRAWARIVPNVKIFGVSLNPGPFSIKEHVLITIMASVGAGSAYATDIVAVQKTFYNQDYEFACTFFFFFLKQNLFLGRLMMAFHRPMDGRHVHAANRIFHWWSLPEVLGQPALYE